jgi:hypothetical protein
MLMVSLATDLFHVSHVCIHFRFPSYCSVFGAVRLRMALSLASWPIQALCRQILVTEGAAVVLADTGTLLCGKGKRNRKHLSINSEHAWNEKEQTHTSAYWGVWY